MPASLYIPAALFPIVLLDWMDAIAGWKCGGNVITRMAVMTVGVMSVTALVTKVGLSQH